MSGLTAVLQMAALGAVCGLLAVPSIVILDILMEYRQRIEWAEEATRWDKLKVYLLFCKSDLGDLDRRAFLKATAKSSAGGAVLLAIVSIFATGLIEVVA